MLTRSADVSVSPLSAEEVRRDPFASAGALRLYVAALFLFPLFLLGFSFELMGSAWFRTNDQDAYLASVGYGARLRGADCQIVIYGDSTAMENVDPLILQQRTGLTACNLAEVGSVQMVNGTAIVDEYLKHNQRPRFIVFVDTPEDLANPSRWEFLSSFEGVYYRVRDQPGWGLAGLFLRHPLEMIDDAETGLLLAIRWVGHRPLGAKQLAFRDAHRGRVLDVGVPIKDCSGIFEQRAPDPVWLRGLRQKYGVDGTRVLIDVTPMPACAPTLPFYRGKLPSGLIDNALETQPLDTFSTSGRLHMTLPGAEIMSRRVADQIARLEGGNH